jgi:hypothetical protein
MVFRIVPPSPTMYPVFESGKQTEYNGYEVPEFWVIQFVPPSIVFSIVPNTPTA